MPDAWTGRVGIAARQDRRFCIASEYMDFVARGGDAPREQAPALGVPYGGAGSFFHETAEALLGTFETNSSIVSRSRGISSGFSSNAATLRTVAS